MTNRSELSEIIRLSTDVCAKEPIHLVGSIQPHGLLIGLDRKSLRLVTKSANVDRYFPSTPVMETPNWLPAALLETCRAVAQENPKDIVKICRIEGLGNIEAHCFLSGAIVFCEFAVTGSATAHQSDEQALLTINQAANEISLSNTIDDLSAITARLVRSLSGFERVLVYQFDKDGNGNVLGECKTDEWQQSFLGLRFPASDIPAQARELYRNTMDRWLPRRDYEPVLLQPGCDQLGAPFDLSRSWYRSVSPVHRMYQANIGVDGSMSISILSQGKLWGLIIGHHRLPHQVSGEVRNMVVTIVRLFTLRLEAILERNARVESEQNMDGCTAMLRKLAAAMDFVNVLTEGKPDIVNLLPGCSGAAVVWKDDLGQQRIRTVGKTPPADDVTALNEWIKEAHDGSLFSTNRLCDHYPPFKTHSAIASGVLSCIFDDDRLPALLLFRPEVIQSIEWAGKPEKLEAAQGLPSLPRRSFERWTEIMRDTSDQWQPWEISTIDTIRATVNEVIIRQTRRVETHKKAEDALRRSETLLQGIFDTSNVSIFLLDTEGKITKANEKMAEMFASPRAELSGLPFLDLVDDREREEARIDLLSLLKGKDFPSDTEGTYRRRDGSVFNGQLTFKPYQDANSNSLGLVGVIMDITQRKQMERLKEEFIAIVSHELRTPLTSIRGALGLISGTMSKEISPKVANLVQIANKNSERLSLIINDIIDIEKITAGKMELRIGPVEIQSFMRHVIEDNQPYGEKHGVRFALKCDVDGLVMADPDRLAQIFSNLMSNAAKFSPRGHEVLLLVENRGAYVRFSVIDKGTGIPSDFRDRVFQKFSQAENPSIRRHEGAGLGLSITKDFVEAMGGTIDFISVAGHGTTFFFDLPRA